MATLKNKLTTILPKEVVVEILLHIISDENEGNGPDEKLNIALEFLCDQDYANSQDKLIKFIYKQTGAGFSAKKTPYVKLMEVLEKNNHNSDLKNSLEQVAKLCYKKDTTNPNSAKLCQLISIFKNDRIPINFNEQNLSNDQTLEEIIKILKSNTIDINAFFGFLFSDMLINPLLLASFALQIPILKELLANGADINTQSSTGTTALMMALMTHNEDTAPITQFLLENGADPNLEDCDGNTVWRMALEICKREDMQLYLKHNINLLKNSDEILYRACQRGQPELVKAILENPDIKLTRPISENLIIAACTSNLEAIEILLEHGADPNIVDQGSTPLIIGVRENLCCIEFVKLLIDFGVNINFQNKNGATTLMWAVRKNSKDVIQLLLESGADPNLLDNHGHNALVHAISENNTEIMEILWKSGATLEPFKQNPELINIIKDEELKEIILREIGEQEQEAHKDKKQKLEA